MRRRWTARAPTAVEICRMRLMRRRTKARQGGRVSGRPSAFGEALARALTPLSRFFFTIAWRCAGRERLDQPMGGGCDLVNRLVERRFICARRPIAAAQLPNELQRRGADLVGGSRRRKIGEGLDISAHNSISLSLFYGIHVYSARNLV